MDKFAPPGSFMELPFYSAHFMDAGLWEPFVRWVAARHGFEVHGILPGFPGTFPTFVVNLRGGETGSSQTCIVVKFFGPLFEGGASFETERSMGALISSHRMSIPSPAVLADGQLSDQWHYLIFEYIPAVSLNQARGVLNAGQLATIARQMGRFMHELHHLPATSQALRPVSLSTRNWHCFTDFLKNQRANCVLNHERWQDLPPHLMVQLPEFISPMGDLIDLRSQPHLIHSDLTGDHLLGKFTSDNPAIPLQVKPGEDAGIARSSSVWESLAIIDWGDSRMGNILYELVALHLDLFQSDLNLLHLCLEAYDLPIYYRHGFPKKALSMALLHQFPLPGYIKTLSLNSTSLDALASQFFGVG